ncbi:ABC transporter permease [Caulobacter sp. S45]|uniref:ABC transporter permease n=1 Tax=Caulobacter sp. S45 TaxID=1641861 RepID=UPI001577396E|nr:ABC transporter permease [Caulobacter sp. S45]
MSLLLPSAKAGGRPVSSNRTASNAILYQYRVLVALFFREAQVRRGAAFALGYMAAGLEPIIIVVAISLLFTALGRQPGYGISLLVFIGTGVFPIYLFIHTSMRLREPFANEGQGRLPIEGTLDHVFVHALLHLLATAVVTTGFFAFLYLVLGQKEALPFDLAEALEALGAIFIFGVAMGMVNSVIARLLPIWNSIWPGVARAAIHFSGMYFIADFLTPDIRRYFAFNPILHGVNWFRTAFYPTYPTNIDNHVYIVLSSGVAITIALLLERIFREKLTNGE